MIASYHPTLATNKTLTVWDIDEDTGTASNCIYIISSVSTVTYAQGKLEFSADDILKEQLIPCDPEKWLTERAPTYVRDKLPFPKPRQRIISERRSLRESLCIGRFARPPPKGSLWTIQRIGIRSLLPD